MKGSIALLAALAAIGLILGWNDGPLQALIWAAGFPLAMIISAAMSHYVQKGLFKSDKEKRNVPFL
jgi:hypothetical protein